MAFFTDKWTIAEISSNNTILVRKSKKTIILERVVGDTSINSREVIARDILEEYDVAVDKKNNIYILYQNKEGHLILNVLKGNNKEEIQLTSEALSEVFELNMVVKDKIIHIFYFIRVSDVEMKYRLYHHHYDENKWNDSIVDEISVNRVLNPIKLIQTDSNILLLYYSSDKKIELREFSIDKLEWNSKVTPISTENDKMFLDAIKINDIIHISYGEFINGNLVIKYNSLHYNEEQCEILQEQYISNEGSPSHPNIILYENKLWVTWIELNKIMSRHSEDMGQNWEPIIYMWNQSRDIDFVRYKYLTKVSKENVLLEHSFGSIYPRVTFMGFGPIDNVTEVPVKKKESMSILRI